MKQRQYAIILVSILGILIWKTGSINARQNNPINDTDRLGMALEYFQSQKYHEALLLFKKLDEEYDLNPRYRAYIGLCHYHLWEYEKACSYLDSVMPNLTVFAPHEQSVYYYANAESHFYLKNYKAAIPCYERMLNVCYDNEKADALYRIGFCYMFTEDWKNAYEYFSGSLAYYQQFGNQTKLNPRLAQIKNMINGCKAHFEISKDSVVTADSTMIIVYKGL